MDTQTALHKGKGKEATHLFRGHPGGLRLIYARYHMQFSARHRLICIQSDPFESHAQTALRKGKGEEATRLYEVIQEAIGNATDDVDWYNALLHHIPDEQAASLLGELISGLDLSTCFRSGTLISGIDRLHLVYNALQSWCTSCVLGDGALPGRMYWLASARHRARCEAVETQQE